MRIGERVKINEHEVMILAIAGDWIGHSVTTMAVWNKYKEVKT